MIIGICGKSGSGKSTLTHKLADIYKDKIVYLSIDKVGHHAIENEQVIEELRKHFGNKIIDNGIVSRKKLGEIVFLKREEMDKLSAITWSYMEKEIDIFLNCNKGKIIVLDWLLLPLTRFFDMCDLKILLNVDYEIRKKRAMKRNNISSSEFDLRENASIDYDITKFDLVSNEVDDLIGKVYRLV